MAGKTLGFIDEELSEEVGTLVFVILIIVILFYI